MKVGDKIKCMNNSIGITDGFTVGKTYQVKSYGGFRQGKHKKSIYVDNDAGITCECWEENFELVPTLTTIDESVTYAKTLMGKKCRDDKGNIYIPDNITVYILKDAAQRSSILVNEYFDKHGFCVGVSMDCKTLPADTLTLVPEYETIELTEVYNAQIFKDKVIVGCQTITKEKIDELHKIMHSLS